MNNVEKWRTVLGWGGVIIFLGAPPLILILHMVGALTGIDKDLDYLQRYYFAVTGVLISLAGLNTFQNVKLNGKNNKNDWTPKPDERKGELQTLPKQ